MSTLFQHLKEKLWYPPYPLRLPLLKVQKRLVPNPYAIWLKGEYSQVLKKHYILEKEPLPSQDPNRFFSLLTLVFNPNPLHFKKCIESVLSQEYNFFEWLLVDNGSTDPKILELLEGLKKHPKIKFFKTPAPLGIAKGTRWAVSQSKAPWIAFLDHDDVIEPNALSELAKAAQDSIDFIYSDSDHINEAERRFQPILKPGPSPEYLLGANYVCHFHALKKEVFQRLDADLADVEGSQDWDLTLRAFQDPKRVFHIPKILYSHRVHPKQYSSTSYRLQDAPIKKEQRRCLERFLNDSELMEYVIEELPGQGLFTTSYRGPWEKELTIHKIDFHKITPEKLFQLLDSTPTPFFALTDKKYKMTAHWKQQGVGILKRRKDVALVGGVAPKNKPIYCDRPRSLLPASAFAFARPDPSVRREVSFLAPGLWLGRTDLKEMIKNVVKVTKMPQKLHALGLKLIYDPTRKINRHLQTRSVR